MDLVVWSITKLVANIFLPPTIFFILIAIGLWQSNKRIWGKWLAIGSLATLVIISLSAVGSLFMKPFEWAVPPLNGATLHGLSRESAMIVVLGGGIRLGAIEYPEGETLTSSSLRRVRYGVRLAKATGLPLTVSGGKTVGGALAAGALMKAYIENELNYPVAFVEDRSFDTRQSAQYAIALIDPKKFHTIVLVTDVLHMPRAARAFEALGVQVIPAPTGFQATGPLRLTDFLPTAYGLALSEFALHELLGEIWYRWRRAIS